MTKIKYYLYTSGIVPLDWTFAFFTVDEFKERIHTKTTQNQHIFNQTLPDPQALIQQIDQLLAEAEQAARANYWTGNYREAPLIFAIPAGNINIHQDTYTNIGTALFGIIIKQQEEGETFIYSPIELKHLERRIGQINQS